MTFAENINRICADRDTTLTAVCKKLNLSTSKVTTWNKGGLPKEKLMIKLAKELDCSIMNFFADEEDFIVVKANNDDEEDILRVYRLLSRKEKHKFMSIVYKFENDNISIDN